MEINIYLPQWFLISGTNGENTEQSGCCQQNRMSCWPGSLPGSLLVSPSRLHTKSLESIELTSIFRIVSI